MFSLDADNRKLCIFHYELWRTFVVKVSLTQFHNFFWNFDTFKAWGGGVGESVLYVYMYVHIWGSDRGRFLLMWRVLDRCERDQVSLQCASLLLFFLDNVFNIWVSLNFQLRVCSIFQYCHLRWHGVNASVLGYISYSKGALTLKYFVFQMLHSMKLIFDIFEYQMVAVTFCLWNMRLHSLQALCSRRWNYGQLPLSFNRWRNFEIFISTGLCICHAEFCGRMFTLKMLKGFVLQTWIWETPIANATLRW